MRPVSTIAKGAFALDRMPDAAGSRSVSVPREVASIGCMLCIAVLGSLELKTHYYSIGNGALEKHFIHWEGC